MREINASSIDVGLADIVASVPVDTERLRLDLGLTMEEFATAVGRSARSISRWRGSDTALRGEAARSVRRLARLQFLLDDVLGRAYTPEWLRSPNRGFRGKAPVDMITEGEAETLIAALERLADGGPT